MVKQVDRDSDADDDVSSVTVKHGQFSMIPLADDFNGRSICLKYISNSFFWGFSFWVTLCGVMEVSLVHRRVNVFVLVSSIIQTSD